MRQHNRLYVLVIVKEFTKCMFAHLLSRKNEAICIAGLRDTLRQAAVIHNRPVMWLRTDLGGEFGGAARLALQSETGVAGQHVPAGCHQTNGQMERANESLMHMIRAMMLAGGIPSSLWGEVALYCVHIHNLSPHRSRKAHPVDGCTVLHLAYMKDTLCRGYSRW